MLFLLTTLNFRYILDDNLDKILDPTPEETDELKEKRKEDDFLYKGHIVDALSNSMYRRSPSAK